MNREQYEYFRNKFVQKNLSLPMPMHLVERFQIRVDEARDLQRKYEIELQLAAK